MSAKSAEDESGVRNAGMWWWEVSVISVGRQRAGEGWRTMPALRITGRAGIVRQGIQAPILSASGAAK